mgnify:FL=1
MNPAKRITSKDAIRQNECKSHYTLQAKSLVNPMYLRKSNFLKKDLGTMIPTLILSQIEKGQSIFSAVLSYDIRLIFQRVLVQYCYLECGVFQIKINRNASILG